MTTIALWFLGFVFAVVIFVVSASIYTRYKDLKQQEEKRKALGKIIREKQRSYLVYLQDLLNTKLIVAVHKQQLSMLINNYFVYQSISMTTARHFDDLYTSLIESIAAINETPEEHRLTVATSLHELASTLPTSPSQYNAQFYNELAPVCAGRLSDRIDSLTKAAIQKEFDDKQRELDAQQQAQVAGDEQLQETSQVNEPSIDSSEPKKRKVTLVTREHLSIR